MKVKDLDKINCAPLHVRRSYVLGCGGMGTEALNHFKRALCQHFDTRYFKAIQILCIDSAQPDYSSEGAFLEEPERTRAFSRDISAVVNNLAANPRIGAWFPEEDIPRARQIVADVRNAVQGAASTRPFGRTGFFEHWSGIYEKLRQLVQQPSGQPHTVEGDAVKVEASDEQHFYIVASLGRYRYRHIL